MSVEGDLVQFLFRNPHSFVHVEAPDEKGVMQRWSVEWGAGFQLKTIRQGRRKRLFFPTRIGCGGSAATRERSDARL